MTAVAGDERFYLAAFSDEIIPCDGTLQGWADWLAKPDPEWQRAVPVANGERFVATVLKFDADIVATRGADGWTFSRQVDGPAFLAVRFGPGLGWDADNIVCADMLADWFRDNDRFLDDVEYIAVGIDQPCVVVTFHADPPRCTAAVIQ
jgi:hypothetical protein